MVPKLVLSAFLLSLWGSGCSQPGPRAPGPSSSDSEYTKIAVDFVQALANEDFAKAREMLAPEAKLTADHLQQRYHDMIGYGDGPADHIELGETLENWAQKKDTDLIWVYVTVAGPEFLEGVAVIVSGPANNPKIREVEWGRP